MENFIEKLQVGLKKGLPGTEVQWQMAPKERFSNFPSEPGKDTLEASVLILLYPWKGSVYTVLTQRQNYKGVHSGQISFPGGKREPSDEDSIQTALREAHEEVGINPLGISVICTLTPLFIPASNIMVTPVLGWMPGKPEFHLQAKEVAYIINADLQHLADPASVKTRPYEIRGRVIEIKYFDYEDNIIWGATAMILQELISVIRNGNIPLETRS